MWGLPSQRWEAEAGESAGGSKGSHPMQAAHRHKEGTATDEGNPLQKAAL